MQFVNSHMTTIWQHYQHSCLCQSAFYILILFAKMVRVGLQISATLENIDKLETHTDYAYFFKLTCTNCGERSDKWHDITESERVQQDSRNTNGFNFYMKCKMCGRENSIDVVEKSRGNTSNNS